MSNHPIITPDYKTRHQYIENYGNLIFRYKNVPYHPELSTFPHHKHDENKTMTNGPVDLQQVVEEIIDW